MAMHQGSEFGSYELENSANFASTGPLKLESMAALVNTASAGAPGTHNLQSSQGMFRQRSPTPPPGSGLGIRGTRLDNLTAEGHDASGSDASQSPAPSSLPPPSTSAAAAAAGVTSGLVFGDRFQDRTNG